METTCSEPQHDLTADRVSFVPSGKHAVHFLVYISSHVRDYSALIDFRLIFCDKWQMIEQ